MGNVILFRIRIDAVHHQGDRLKLRIQVRASPVHPPEAMFQAVQKDGLAFKEMGDKEISSPSQSHQAHAAAVKLLILIDPVIFFQRLSLGKSAVNTTQLHSERIERCQVRPALQIFSDLSGAVQLAADQSNDLVPPLISLGQYLPLVQLHILRSDHLRQHTAHGMVGLFVTNYV